MSYQSTAAGRLAQALYALDRLEDADAWAGRAAELGSSDDAMTQMLWRQVRAKVLARHGEHVEGRALAREASDLCERTDMLDDKGDSYADLAEVLHLGKKPGEAVAALEQALARYDARAISSWPEEHGHASPSSGTQRRRYRRVRASSRARRRGNVWEHRDGRRQGPSLQPITEPIALAVTRSPLQRSARNA